MLILRNDYRPILCVAAVLCIIIIMQRKLLFFLFLFFFTYKNKLKLQKKDPKNKRKIYNFYKAMQF